MVRHIGRLALAAICAIAPVAAQVQAPEHGKRYARLLIRNAIVSLVGRGFFRYQGLSRRIFEALSDVNVVMISFAASDVNISVLVAEADAERAVHSLHREFFYKSAEGPSADEKSNQKSSGGRKSPKSCSLPR